MYKGKMMLFCSK